MDLKLGTMYRIYKGNRSGIVRFIGPVIAEKVLWFKVIDKGDLYSDYDKQASRVYFSNEINLECCKPLSDLELAIYSL